MQIRIQTTVGKPPMSKPASNQTFKLTLRPEGRCTEPEGFRRLKACLKSMLRSYGLRCTAVVANGSLVTAEGVTREASQ